MHGQTPSRLVLAVAAGLAAAACGGDGPAAPGDARLDAARATADVRSFEQAFSANAWESFAALSPRFGVAPAVGAAVAGLRDVAAVPSDASPAARRRAATSAATRVLAALSPGAPIRAVLPPEVLGTTFVYDPARQRYVPDPSRTGAPANGARFILYAINPVTRQPIVEQEIGFADLMDESASRTSGIALHLRVVSGGVTYLDYLLAADGTPTTGALAAGGFLTDGTTRLDFRIEARARHDSAGEAMDLDFAFDVPVRAFTTVAHVSGAHTASGDLGHVAMTIHSGDATLDFDVVGDDRQVSATVRVNGQLFATISGSPGQPGVRGAGGLELTPQEAEALRQMLGLVGRQFELLGELLRPVAG